MEKTSLENWIVHKTGITECTRRSLEEYQLHKIKEMIAYAKQSSMFYKDYFINIKEDVIQSLTDFRNVPFTASQQISQNPYSFLCVPQRDVKRIITLNSSGTTGKEKRIFFTEEDLDLTVDFFTYGFQPMLKTGDRVLVLFPGNSYGSIGDVIKKALSFLNVECFVQGVLVNPDETARLIVENQINAIVGIPMQVLYFSRVQSEVFKNRIDKVLLSADYVPEVLICELNEQCGCKVFTHYGSSEMGFGGGVECAALNGYHVREADLYFEIINPETGESVKDGDYGEIVFTTLTRQAMPLIRYRTGDIGAFTKETCECGTILRTMKRSLGRIENRVLLSGNHFIYLRELDELILANSEVFDYQSSIENEEILVLEIMTASREIFDKLKDHLVMAVQNYFQDKFGYIIKVKCVQRQGKEPVKIANSMIKRRIVDNRRKSQGEISFTLEGCSK
jgi:phenylacetate-coenzyme A ligase PaaK-like adenylate-forming protein